MSLIPITLAFVIAMVGATAVGLRPGYSFGALLLGATMVSAMTGLAASALQFLPQRYFLPAAAIAGTILGVLVSTMLRAAVVLDFGAVRDPASLVWPVAAVAGLVVSRAAGMRLPARRRRPNVHRG